MKVFKPKCDMPKLTSYAGGATAEYWAGFPSSQKCVGQALVCAKAVRRLASEIGCSDWNRLEVVCRDLEEGADMGAVVLQGHRP